MSLKQRVGYLCLALILVLICACAGTVEPQGGIRFRGALIPIRPVPSSVPQGAGWVVKAFARGEGQVRGNIDADETARRDLAMVPGIAFEREDKWGAVVFDWVGLNVLSHARHVISVGLPAVTMVEPQYPHEVITSMLQAGQFDVNCVIRFTIEEDGSVSSPRIEVSSGYELADRAALDAIRGFKYGPALQAGRPMHLETDRRFGLQASR